MFREVKYWGCDGSMSWGYKFVSVILAISKWSCVLRRRTARHQLLCPKVSSRHFTVFKKEIHSPDHKIGVPTTSIFRWMTCHDSPVPLSQRNPMSCSGPPPDPQAATYQQPPQQNQQQSPQQNQQADKNGGGGNGETTKMLVKTGLKAGETLGEMEESWRIQIRVGKCLDVSYFLSVISFPCIAERSLQSLAKCNQWSQWIYFSWLQSSGSETSGAKWGNRVTSFPTFAYNSLSERTLALSKPESLLHV